MKAPPLYRRARLRPGHHKESLGRERESMIAAIRRFAKSWVATVLFGLLIISFAVFGIGNRDLFHARISNAVITAGPRTVSMGEYKREFDGYKAQVEQQVGQPIT